MGPWTRATRRPDPEVAPDIVPLEPARTGILRGEAPPVIPCGHGNRRAPRGGTSLGLDAYSITRGTKTQSMQTTDHFVLWPIVSRWVGYHCADPRRLRMRSVPE